MEKRIGNWTVSVERLFQANKNPPERIVKVHLRYNSGIPGGEHTFNFSEKEYEQFVQLLSDNSVQTEILHSRSAESAPVLRGIVKAYQATLIFHLNPNHPGMFFEQNGSLKKIDGFNVGGSILITGKTPILVHPETPIYIIY